MTHNNRGRLTVDLGGKWRLYTNIIPSGGVALGTVTKDDATGALVWIEHTGIYVRLNAGAQVVLPQAKTQAAVDAARAAGIRSKRQNEQCATVRCAFVDYVDMLERNGDISQLLAERVTL